MSDVKQVKVDNWGIYFLQRLKHFFNRTDYCDLTLQFQDNAQLKVHRLVLSACTEYFELLERTCEMYEDCLVMPDDLQADVVVPIVNFMYTGQLEFKMDMLEKLYQTSLVMNMPVLSKLLDAHRFRSSSKSSSAQSYNNNTLKRNTRMDSVRQLQSRHTPSPSRMTSSSTKRSYSSAFQTVSTPKPKIKAVGSHIIPTASRSPPRAPSPAEVIQNNKKKLREPRPTRYELPEELDTDNVFENSFSNISYTSTPLMVHPDSTKHYPSKKGLHFQKKLMKSSTMEIVECKKMKPDSIFLDDVPENTVNDESDFFQSSLLNDSPRDPSQLFDQMLDSNESPKVVIETKGSKQASNIDHAKIISEVLKKYPHLVKSNKNIKLKILNTPSSSKGKKGKISNFIEEREVKPEPQDKGYTYETDVLDSKEAAKLIAMGAENIKGPWICLICGTPGRALHFTSYYKFRRHLVEVHNEKCVPTICEYCGFKSFKRNYMVHHCYTKHGVQPPPQYNFPKCNYCDYVAITEGFLVKHKVAQHSVENKQFRCNVCMQAFIASSQLLAHMQKTGHKFTDKRPNLQCIYCLKMFQREGNLYAHLKTNHKLAATRDGIVDDSDEEKERQTVKREVVSYDDESDEVDVHYQIHQRADGYHVVSKKPSTPSSIASISNLTNKQKILNPGFSKPSANQQQPNAKPARITPTVHNEFMQDEVITQNTVMNTENIIVIDNVEYVMKDNELTPRKNQKEYILPDIMNSNPNQSIDTTTPSTSMQFANIQGTENAKMIIKKSNMNQPIQIVVSNEEEYKALMSSNHSIIFDDGDVNKTLTMMTAPHNTTLDTSSIDMESTQSNDMMIIQDDYPLNVTEAVATDNNIVVVYSHPVDQITNDTSKQYQIITSQDIGAQFIQSSAMITQNYETVTTSTPVMSANVIDAHISGPWQNNGQEIIGDRQIQITSDVNLQSMTQIKDVDESLVELPEVEITSLPKETSVEVSANDNNLEESTIMTEDDVSQADSGQANETIDSVSVTPKDTDVTCSLISNKETNFVDSDIATEEMDVTTLSENNLVQEEQAELTINQNTIIDQQEGHYQDQAVIDNNVENDIPDGNCEETVEQMEIQTEPNEMTENITEQTETLPIENVIQTNADKTSIIEPAVIKVAKEQIQTLTSEWSDEEYDTTEDSSVLKEATKSEHEEDNQPSGESQEIEETIENIQQEVDKEMPAVPINESMDSTVNDRVSSEIKESVATSTSQEKAPVAEKLSSLLNDWEDNDSQDENNENVNSEVTVNESDQENGKVIIAQEENGDENEAVDDLIVLPPNSAVENVPESEQTNENLEPKKDDKIKSLVSDWDDDEEEKE